jgi:hypothetical protein
MLPGRLAEGFTVLAVWEVVLLSTVLIFGRIAGRNAGFNEKV